MQEKWAKKLKEIQESGEEEEESKPVELTIDKISKDGSMKMGFN